MQKVIEMCVMVVSVVAVEDTTGPPLRREDIGHHSDQFPADRNDQDDGKRESTAFARGRICRQGGAEEAGGRSPPNRQPTGPSSPPTLSFLSMKGNGAGGGGSASSPSNRSTDLNGQWVEGGSTSVK